MRKLFTYLVFTSQVNTVNFFFVCISAAISVALFLVQVFGDYYTDSLGVELRCVMYRVRIPIEPVVRLISMGE